MLVPWKGSTVGSKSAFAAARRVFTATFSVSLSEDVGIRHHPRKKERVDLLSCLRPSIALARAHNASRYRVLVAQICPTEAHDLAGSLSGFRCEMQYEYYDALKNKRWAE